MKFMLISSLFISLSLWGGNLLIKKSGELRGILTAKGEAWIEVKEDNGLLERYLAPWLGGSPARGGGFDLNMLEIFKDLIVGNRVYLNWFWDGHLRVLKVKNLKPLKKSGFFHGTLINKGDKWIDVEDIENNTPWRFYAKWVGGLPEHGGSYHSETLEFFEVFEVSTPVHFIWSYDHRPRIDRFIEQEEDVFVPFYIGKPPLGSPSKIQSIRPILNPLNSVSPSPTVNPFDQLPSTNPFDQAPKLIPVNPFEVTPPPTQNPFESASPKASSPFEAVGKKEQESQAFPKSNPFEQVPKPKQEGNPFENLPLPGNPFEATPPN